jgi:hypothetical protein
MNIKISHKNFIYTESGHIGREIPTQYLYVNKYTGDSNNFPNWYYCNIIKFDIYYNKNTYSKILEELLTKYD